MNEHDNEHEDTGATAGNPAFTPNPDNPIPPNWPGRPDWPGPDFPPVDWRCMFHGPVSGRYEGSTGALGFLSPVLDLRVDVDRRYANSPVLNKLSGDIYTWRFGGRIVGPIRTFIESWIVDEPRVRWQRCKVQISGTVRYWRSTHAATELTVTIPFSSFSTGPATATFTTNAGSTTYVCARKSNCFRHLKLETDYCASVQAAPQEPSYDTTWHSDRPAGTPQRTLSIAETYREAGIDVTMDPAHTIIDDSAPTFSSWSPAELHDSMEVSFSQMTASWPRWNMWGMLAGEFDNSNVGGIMFDAAAAFGGAGEAPERQGFTVFRNHSWFDDLRTGTPTTQAEAAAMRKFLYTWIHEAGHAFNFLHSWDKSRPDALSWMNYDWKYDDRNGVDSFWNNFNFRFDDEELLHMRHGDRVSVIMGGDPWSSGGHLESPAEAFTRSEAGAPVELLLRSTGYVEFMEPVSIELRLRNLSDTPVEIDARLASEFGNVAIFIRRPDGRIVMHGPIMCQLGDPIRRKLEPLRDDGSNEGRDRYSELVPLAYGSAGFSFDQPGDYQIRAVYDALGITVSSNTLKLRVGRPMSRDEDRFAADFFSHQVGMSLYLGGSQSPFLATGMDVLHQTVDQFKETPVALKAARILAKSVGRSFHRRADDRRKLVCTHQADPAEALKLTAPALDFYQKTPRKSLNLAYHQLVRERAGYLSQQGDLDVARNELRALYKNLEGRSVHPPVLASIKAYEERLETAPAKAA
jgi:hypothetical protein